MMMLHEMPLYTWNVWAAWFSERQRRVNGDTQEMT